MWSEKMKHDRKKIEDKIEVFEYYHSGMKYCNGWVIVKIKEIEDEENYLKVYAEVRLCQEDKTEIHHDCYYYMDKKDYHLLNKKELEELNVVV